MKIFTYAQVLNTQLKGFSKLIGFNYSGSRAETKAKSRILPEDRSPLDLGQYLDQSPEYLAAASALRHFTDHCRRVNWLERFERSSKLIRVLCYERCLDFDYFLERSLFIYFKNNCNILH